MVSIKSKVCHKLLSIRSALIPDVQPRTSNKNKKLQMLNAIEQRRSKSFARNKKRKRKKP